MLLFLLMAGCGAEFTLDAHDDEPPPADDPPADTAPPAPVDTAEQTPVDTAPPGPTGPTGPRAPVAGDLKITELMIDPAAVSDSNGEYVELLVTADVDVDLASLVLADDGVDHAVLRGVGGDLVFGPGDRVVLCADSDSARNGGVTCDGDYLYDTFGDGFALSNGGDEVVLQVEGAEIGAHRYGEGFAAVGAAVGLAGGSWCAQRSALPGGDEGTPGAANDPC